MIINTTNEWLKRENEIVKKKEDEEKILDVEEYNELDIKEDISKIVEDITITSNIEPYIDLNDALVVDYKIENKSNISLKKVHHKWTKQEIVNLKEFYFYCVEHKEEAERYFQRKWESIRNKASYLKLTSMKENKKCSLFLGYYIAERVLSYVYKDVKRMPLHNHGYDFICNKGKKIDVKSSCLRKNNTYSFSLNCNKIADYFLCIGFNNREELIPQHLWLIKGSLVDEVKALVITNTEFGLSQLFDYELTNKVKDVIDCCNELKK